MRFEIGMIWTIIFYGIMTGLAIEFLLTSEKAEITIPMKVFYALLILVFTGIRSWDKNKEK